MPVHVASATSPRDFKPTEYGGVYLDIEQLEKSYKKTKKNC